MPNQILEFINSSTSHEPAQQPLSVLIETDSAQPLEFSLLNFQNSKTAYISIVDENILNQRRLLNLRNQVTPLLINLIMESNFEYGVDSQPDVFIRSLMKENSLVTKSWLNNIYVENISNPIILVGILRIISRLHYHEIHPEGLLIATAALSHANVGVQECGVRAFESWGNLDSLRILNNSRIDTPWLQDYINEVVKDLSRAHNVSISQKN